MENWLFYVRHKRKEKVQVIIIINNYYLRIIILDDRWLGAGKTDAHWKKCLKKTILVS